MRGVELPPGASPRRDGFTLIELLAGMSVMVGVLASAYLCLHAGFESEKTIEWRIDAARNARVALSLLSADLRGACRLSEEQEFVGMDRVLGSMEADNVDFATHNYAPRMPGEGDFCEVSYFVDRNQETGETGLWRRRDPSPDAQPLDGGLKQEIAAGLRLFRLEYYDGLSWYDSWGQASQAERGGSSAVAGYYNLYGLPEAVRVTLAFSRPERPDAAPSGPRKEGEPSAGEAPLVFQSVVYLNLAGRAWGSSTAADSGGGR